MLSYAFQDIKCINMKKQQTEMFENLEELYAEIIISVMEDVIKSGIEYNYIEVEEYVSGIKGRLLIDETINKGAFINKKNICCYDEYNVDNEMNRIIKSTLFELKKHDISKNRKLRIYRILDYFDEVSVKDLRFVNWELRFDRNSTKYRFVISMCKLYYDGLIKSQKQGNKFQAYFNEEIALNRLFEKFLLGYYRKEHRKLKVSAPHIPWIVSDGKDEYLPIMRTDVMLENEDRMLILDAKYYSKIFQEYYDKKKIRSAHLYQMFAYIKNEQEYVADRKIVDGILLYAKTDETDHLDCKYKIGNNYLGIMTIDLNADFKDIRNRLDSITNEYIYEVN